MAAQKNYLPRVADLMVEESLGYSGGVLLEGVRQDDDRTPACVLGGGARFRAAPAACGLRRRSIPGSGG